MEIVAHHWQDQKLVLDLRCAGWVSTFGDDGKWKSGRGIMRAAVAILDAASEKWSVIRGPEVKTMGWNTFYHRTTLYRDEVFTSEGGQLRKHRLRNGDWEILEVSDGEHYELFSVHDHLYAANETTILEILDGGKRTRVLASGRRSPPASVLDTEPLGTPTLFAGPRGSLRVCTPSRILTWAGDDWRDVCPAPPFSFAPTITPDGILFLTNGRDAAPRLSRLQTGSDTIEGWTGRRSGRGPRGAPARPTTLPRFVAALLSEVPPSSLAITTRGADLYVLLDNASTEPVVNTQENVVTGHKVLPREGYHAVLNCFSSHAGQAQRAFLRFAGDGQVARLPVTGADTSRYTPMSLEPQPWMVFSSNSLFLGLEHPGRHGGLGGGSATRSAQTGVWRLALDKIDPDLAAQRQAQALAKPSSR